MTRFLDVRASTTGGNLASEVGINQGTNINNYQSVDLAQLATDIRGKHVLVGIHGYNVSRADGILHLSNWEGLLKLPDPSIFIGLLWPGDSVWAHGLDYPDEPKIANEAGEMIGPFLDANFTTAASISLASHSLGARVLLETISNMKLKVRRVLRRSQRARYRHFSHTPAASMATAPHLQISEMRHPVNLRPTLITSRRRSLAFRKVRSTKTQRPPDIISSGKRCVSFRAASAHSSAAGLPVFIQL